MLARRIGSLAVLVATMVATTLGLATPAEAQLDAGRRALAQADFQRAIRAFDRAERTETLDREGLISLYEGRVIARFAVGTRSRAQRDLQILGALDPDHGFPVEVPPEVGEALAAVVRASGGGLGAELAWSDEAGGSVLRVTVLRDVADIVRDVRVHTRVGDGAWSTSSTREVHVAHGEGVVVSAWVELLGAHDVVLAAEASETAPSTHGEVTPTSSSVVAATEPVAAGPPLLRDADTNEGDDALALGLGLGLGGAALVAAAVVLGVVFGTQTSSDTQPTLTVVAF